MAVQNERIAILVVEDEPLVRFLMVEAFTDEGFDVFEAASADEAISILESESSIRLLFTDIDMPGTMDGLRLAAFVRDRWPPVKIIIASGHHNLALDAAPFGDRFFAKPYQPEAVIASFRELLLA